MTQSTPDHPDAARMRDVVAPLKAALDDLPERHHEENFGDLMAVVDEATKLVKLINDQADELNARWRMASLPMNPVVYNDVMEHAAIARGDLPSCVGCARLSTEHRAGCPNG